MYLYECSHCGNVHDIDINLIGTTLAAELPERECFHCNETGCADCVVDGVCAGCREDFEREDINECRPGCLACLNDWSHGDDRD